MKNGMIALVSLLLAGCGKPQTPVDSGPPGTNPAAAPSAGASVVDVLTQRNKIEAGKKAKAVIDAVSAQEKKDLDAVLND